MQIMPKLTKRFVDAVEPGEGDKIIFDDALSGFGLRLSPAGRKTFVVQYRSRGRTRRMSLGKFGVVTCDDARKKARQVLGAVAGGKDPSAARDAKRKSPTLEALAERFLTEHVSVKCKPRTLQEYARLLDKKIVPEIGSWRVADVKRAEIAEYISRLSKTPYQANRILAILRKMFQLADIWGLRPETGNPCHGITKFPEQKKERYLNTDEIKRLIETMDKRLADGVEGFQIVGIVKLLLFTGCRLSEIQFLKWSYIKDGYLLLPESKTGARRIPLNDKALAVIRNLPRFLTSEYLFWGDGACGAIVNVQKPWRRTREAAGLNDVRLHDLRHTFASIAVQNEVPLPVVGKLLGHSQIQTTMRYAHLADENLKSATQQIAEVLTKSIEEEIDRESA